MLKQQDSSRFMVQGSQASLRDLSQPNVKAKLSLRQKIQALKFSKYPVEDVDETSD